VLTVLLGVFGAALAYSVQTGVLRAIDEGLTARAIRAAAGRSGRGGPGNFRRGPHRTQLSPPADPSSPEEDALEAEAERTATIRRPRMLNREGESFTRRGGVGPWDETAFRMALLGRPIHSTVRVDGENLRVASVPWVRDGQIVGVVQVARELDAYEELRTRQLQMLLLLIPAGLLAAVGGGWFLTNRALRPVRDVTLAAEQISAADLSRRLQVAGDDELAELARTFNGMIARLEEAFRSREEAFERLAAAYEQQRRFVSDASHELRTPLTRIKGSTSLALSRERTPEEYRKSLRVADTAADAMHRLLQDLLLLARSDAQRLEPQRQVVDLAVVVRDAAAQLPEEAVARIQQELPGEPCPVLADPTHLARVFVNLLENAVRHTPPEGRILVVVRAEGERVVAEVADTGEGIAAEHLPHVFERFYRVDAARSRPQGGTGLGLAISKSLVEAHGGTISLASEVGRGATFTVALPRAASTGPNAPR
jgi:signal transduction histidine kinase